jgi:hypothetical protein
MRYVLANRRAGKYGREAQMSSRAAVATALGVLTNTKVLADQNPDKDPTARRIVVFDAEPGEVEAKRIHFSTNIIVEPEIKYYLVSDLFTHTLLSDFLPPDRFIATPAPSGSPFQITVASPPPGSGQPLSGVSVTLYSRGPGNLQRMHTELSDGQGKAVFDVANGFSPAAVVAVPRESFWTVVRRAPDPNITIYCPPLPKNGPGAWWHKALGITSPGDPQLGHGIKIGVIDTGCGPNRALSHVTRVGAFIDGVRYGAGDAADVEGHGSHTAGIIGARPINSGDYAGIAPGAELFAGRVFPKGDGATQANIADAIDVLSRDVGCDLLNLSLGSTERSAITEDAI